MDPLQLLLNPLTGVFAMYVALMAVGAMLIQPVRIKLMRVGAELIKESKFQDRDREAVLMMLDSSTSFLTGLVMILATISSTIDVILGRKEDDLPQALMNDERGVGFLLRWAASVAVANPLAFVIWIPLSLASLVIELALLGRAGLQTASVPAYRAASARMPGARLA